MHGDYSFRAFWSMMVINKNLGDESTVLMSNNYWTSNFLFLACLTDASRQLKQFGWRRELILEKAVPQKKDFRTCK